MNIVLRPQKCTKHLFHALSIVPLSKAYAFLRNKWISAVPKKVAYEASPRAIHD
jgi:hypothetical protein